jgi:hypothetical protein
MREIGATDHVKKGLLVIWSDVDPDYHLFNAQGLNRQDGSKLK